jgi:hypothetical protein
MKKILNLALLIAIATTSCKKKEDPEPEPEPTPAPAPSPASSNVPHTFENLTFNAASAFFSTNGSMTAPVDSTQAKSIVASIDLTFFFNYDYTEPGFLDPKARSQTWYWNDYKKTWLSGGVETRFYSSTLTKTQFDEAKADQAKIGTFFAATTVSLAPHAIFPTGSCIGGRESSSPASIKLAKGQVFIFKNTASGKRGLLYIRTDQPNGWPIPISNTNTKVDIVREK